MNPLILWGGTDINPKLYGEEPLPTTQRPDEERDNRELKQIYVSIYSGQPIIGICRGAQLLCSANGGKLHQHRPEHSGNLSSHSIVIYDLNGVKKEIIDSVAASHHQIMIPGGKYIILGRCAFDDMPEIVYWPRTRCLGIQPHPEWMNKDHPFNLYLKDLCESLFGITNVLTLFGV